MFDRLKLSGPFLFLSLLVFLGVVDTAYLTETHLRRTALVCGAISSLSGCNIVASSSYSEIYGIPVALLGLLFYLAVITGTAFYYWHGRNKSLLRWLTAFTGAGLFFSLYLLYVQATVLKEFCQYCLISDLLTAIIFAILAVSYRRNRKLSPAAFSTDKENE